MRLPILMSCLAIALVAGCSRESAEPATPAAKPQAAAIAQVIDEHSYAEPAKVATNDLALDLALDASDRLRSLHAMTR